MPRGDVLVAVGLVLCVHPVLRGPGAAGIPGTSRCRPGVGCLPDLRLSVVWKREKNAAPGTWDLDQFLIYLYAWMAHLEKKIVATKKKKDISACIGCCIYLFLVQFRVKISHSILIMVLIL